MNQNNLIESELVLELASKNHFVVCKALKILFALPEISDETILRMANLVSSGVIAIERVVLEGLSKLGKRAFICLPVIVVALANNFERHACNREDCSACGFSYCYFAVHLYGNAIGALCDLSDLKTQQTILSWVEKYECREVIADFLTQT